MYSGNDEGGGIKEGRNRNRKGREDCKGKAGGRMAQGMEDDKSKGNGTKWQGEWREDSKRKG